MNVAGATGETNSAKEGQKTTKVFRDKEKDKEKTTNIKNDKEKTKKYKENT